jgi:hypothetical protein
MWRALELVLYPVLAFTALVVFLYPAFVAPVAFRFPMIFVGLCGIVACCYLSYWCQRPGIYKSKTPLRWFWHIALTIALLVLTPIIAIFASILGVHVVWHRIRLNKLLGLDLRFERGEGIRIRSDATSTFRPGAQGWVRNSRLIRQPEVGKPYVNKRTILYLVQWENGGCAEIPEQCLEEWDRWRKA